MRHTAVSFRLNMPTISAANVKMRHVAENGKTVYEDSTYIVQVTSKMVLLLDMFSEDQEDVWKPEADERILLADISPSQICVALTGGVVVLLQILSNKLVLQNRS